MQPVLSTIWTRVALSISYNDNHYTTGTASSSYMFLVFPVIHQGIKYVQ